MIPYNLLGHHEILSPKGTLLESQKPLQLSYSKYHTDNLVSFVFITTLREKLYVFKMLRFLFRRLKHKRVENVLLQSTERSKTSSGVCHAKQQVHYLDFLRTPNWCHLSEYFPKDTRVPTRSFLTFLSHLYSFFLFHKKDKRVSCY